MAEREIEHILNVAPLSDRIRALVQDVKSLHEYCLMLAEVAYNKGKEDAIATAGDIIRKSLSDLYQHERILSVMIQRYITEKRIDPGELHTARDQLRGIMRKMGWKRQF